MPFSWPKLVEPVCAAGWLASGAVGAWEEAGSVIRGSSVVSSASSAGRDTLGGAWLKFGLPIPKIKYAEPAATRRITAIPTPRSIFGSLRAC